MPPPPVFPLTATFSGTVWTASKPDVPTNGVASYSCRFDISPPSGSPFSASNPPNLAGSSASTNGSTYAFDDGDLPLSVTSFAANMVVVTLTGFTAGGNLGSTIAITIQLSYTSEPG